MTEQIAAALIASGALFAVVALICSAVLRALDMKLTHVERVRDREDDDALDARLRLIEQQTDAHEQQIKDVRSSLTIKGLR